MPQNRKWRSIENLCALAGTLDAYEHGECKEAEQQEVCARTYLHVVDELVSRNFSVLPTDPSLEWPKWPNPENRHAYVSVALAKERAQPAFKKNLLIQGKKVLRECRKIEAVMDSIRRDYGGQWPSGDKLPDKLNRVLKALWEQKEEERFNAVSVENLDDEASAEQGIRDMPEDYYYSHQYFLAWSMFGGLGICHNNLFAPDVGDGPHLEPVAVKTEGDEKENEFPRNPNAGKKKTSRAAQRKKKRKTQKDAGSTDSDSDDDDDDDVHTLKSINNAIHELVAVKKSKHRLKAAEKLCIAEPSEKNKENYKRLFALVAEGKLEESAEPARVVAPIRQATRETPGHATRETPGHP